MAEGEKPKNKGGRPRKHPAGTRIPTLAFRVRRGLHGQLLDASERNEQSVSEVIEERLLRSFAMSEAEGDQETENLVTMVRHAARAAHARTGKAWHQSDFNRRSMSRTLRILAALIEPRGDRELGALTDEAEAVALAEGRIFAEAAWAVCQQASDPGMARVVDRVYRKVADEIEGRD